MPGKPIKIGPFVGGLNNISQSGEADDDEVVQLYNFEVENDNSLTTRPPMQVHGTSTLPVNVTIGWDILGIYRVSDTEWYLITSAPTNLNNSDTTIRAYLNGLVGTGETMIVIKNVIGLINRPTGMVQFKDRLYFLNGNLSTDQCFSWKKGEAAGGTNIPDMKKGTVLISWKARLWVSGTQNYTTGDRVYFSNVGAGGPEPTVWPATNFFDVAPGEGGFITALVPSYNNLLVFKTDGTWRFSYPSQPADGQVDKINGAVGAANKNAVLEYENYIYVYDQGALYELINSNYTQINRFVEFREDPYSVDAVAPGVDISIMNRKLMVRYYNSLYVFNIETKTWSNWFSYIGTPGKFQELPVDSQSSASSVYIAASKGTQQSVSPNLIQDPDSRDEAVNAARKVVSNGTLDITAMGVYTLTNREGAVLAIANINRTGSDSEYDLPVSVGQKLTLTATVSTWSTGCSFRLTYLLKDGNTVIQNHTPTATGFYAVDAVVPVGAILARLSLVVVSSGVPISFAVTDMIVVRKAGPAAFNLISIQDEYPDTISAVEFIDAWVETKSYDYQASSTNKRLFYWAADVVTPRAVQAEARPVARLRAVTWDMLEAYTWDELEGGTWDNPLSFVGMTRDIVDYTDPNASSSANGRFVLKLKKSLRFRQISYYIRMSSLGNKETGPAKLFSLTTYVLPKQEVVDKVS
jgi:hypothetical protein